MTMGEELGCGGGYEKGWVWSCGWGGGGGNHHGRYVLRLQPQRKKFLVASSPQSEKGGKWHCPRHISIFGLPDGPTLKLSSPHPWGEGNHCGVCQNA